MTFKHSIVAAVLGATLGLGAFTMPATADVGVNFYLGAPHYRDRMGPDYRFRPGYGWYLPRDIRRNRLSCAEARRLVRDYGYRNVATRDCSGRTYAFLATRRGFDVRVFVNARTGRVWAG